MCVEENSGAQVRKCDETHGERQDQKRPRFSGPSAGVLELSRQSLGGSVTVKEEEGDGCDTPPREPESPAPSSGSLATTLEAGRPSYSAALLPPRSIDEDYDELEEDESMAVQAPLNLAQSSQRSVDRELERSSGALRTSCTATITCDGAQIAQSTPIQTQQVYEGLSRQDLIRLLARDEQLRAWANDGSKHKVDNAKLGQLMGHTGCCNPQSLRQKVLNMRRGYKRFLNKLSMEGQATPTCAWVDSDVRALSIAEQNVTQDRWLGIWHDEIALRPMPPSDLDSSSAQVQLVGETNDASFGNNNNANGLVRASSLAEVAFRAPVAVEGPARDAPEGLPTHSAQVSASQLRIATPQLREEALLQRLLRAQHTDHKRQMQVQQAKQKRQMKKQHIEHAQELNKQRAEYTQEISKLRAQHTELARCVGFHTAKLELLAKRVNDQDLLQQLQTQQIAMEVRTGEQQSDMLRHLEGQNAHLYAEVTRLSIDVQSGLSSNAPQR